MAYSLYVAFAKLTVLHFVTVHIQSEALSFQSHAPLAMKGAQTPRRSSAAVLHTGSSRAWSLPKPGAGTAAAVAAAIIERAKTAEAQDVSIVIYGWKDWIGLECFERGSWILGIGLDGFERNGYGLERRELDCIKNSWLFEQLESADIPTSRRLSYGQT